MDRFFEIPGDDAGELEAMAAGCQNAEPQEPSQAPGYRVEQFYLRRRPSGYQVLERTREGSPPRCHAGGLGYMEAAKCLSSLREGKGPYAWATEEKEEKRARHGKEG